VVLAAEGPNFTGGLDLSYLAQTFARNTEAGPCPARQRRRFLDSITAMQTAYSVLEMQPWPVIAMIQGGSALAHVLVLAMALQAW
jgi:enoyl-CoA hydratase/carnithine racemase